MAITGQYKRSGPGCFRKEGSGKIYFDDGCWYISDRLGQQVAYVSGELARVPKTGWQTKGEGFFGSWEDLPITVEFRQLPQAQPSILATVQSEVGCSSMCQKMKEQLPDQHRQTLDGFEVRTLERKESFKATASSHLASAKDLHAQHWPVMKEKALQHGQTAKDKFNEYHPVVKQKAQEGYTKCYDFWTHPDTVDKMKTTKNSCLDGVKWCLAGSVTMAASLVESACGKSGPEAAEAPVSESDQAMEASYVKLDSTTPVLVETTLPPVPIPPGMNPSIEPTTLPPNRALFLGDDDSAVPDNAVH